THGTDDDDANRHRQVQVQVQSGYETGQVVAGHGAQASVLVHVASLRVTGDFQAWQSVVRKHQVHVLRDFGVRRRHVGIEYRFRELQIDVQALLGDRLSPAFVLLAEDTPRATEAREVHQGTSHEAQPGVPGERPFDVGGRQQVHARQTVAGWK